MEVLGSLEGLIGFMVGFGDRFGKFIVIRMEREEEVECFLG